jgi:branched-chain amino acid transport system substrate-binding protein
MDGDDSEHADDATSETRNRPTVANGTDRRADRRAFLKATGGVAVGAAVAGCISGGGGDGGDGGGTGEDAATGTSSDGNATGTAGGSVGETITIGAMGPADAPQGASILNSAKLAASEINADGGIAGAEVEVVTKDTKDDPGTARSGYQELTTGENVAATVGIFGSEQLLAIMDTMAQQESPFLGAGAATPEATRRVKENYEKYKYLFRVGPPNSTFLAESLVEFGGDMFESMGWSTIGLVAEDFKWTEPVTEILENNLASETGVEVAYNERIAEGTEDWTPIYDELQSNEVDGAFVQLAHIGTTSLVSWAKQAREFGYGGIHVPDQFPSFYQSTEGAAHYTFSQTTATPTAEITEKTKPYAEAYDQEYDGFPVYSGYSAYDAVYILKQAIESAGSTNADDIVSELEGASYTGTSGTVEFYGQNEEFPHDVKYGPEFVQGVYFQWQADEEGNGAQEVIWPEDLATAEYQPPER